MKISTNEIFGQSTKEPVTQSDVHWEVLQFADASHIPGLGLAML